MATIVSNDPNARQPYFFPLDGDAHARPRKTRLRAASNKPNVACNFLRGGLFPQEVASLIFVPALLMTLRFSKPTNKILMQLKVFSSHK